jgi:Ca2+-binding RTX toxin-like protein
MSLCSKNARRTATLATMAAAAALALPAVAGAAVTGQVTGNTAVLTGDAAPDTILIDSDDGLLTHNTLAGFESATDFDTDGGVQTLTTAATLTIDGGDGDDIIVGGPNADNLIGNAGNDRLTGFTGDDDIDGGDGNDLMQWNNGDGTDTNDGDGGIDETLITGRNTTDDMTVANGAAGRVLFTRAAPGGFSVDIATTERLQLTPFAGDDRLVAQPDVTLPMTIDAGPGVDDITAGGGGDRVIGGPGDDTLNGNAGDDTLVWNNGDGTDVMNGQAGLDRIENNLGAADDVSQVKVVNGIVRYDRVNAPFGLNIATSEVFELNTFGGNDTLDVSAGVGGLIAIAADAGAGDDRFNGGDEADTFFGGLGNDTLDPGTGSDAVDGQDGNDTLAIRDRAADLARGGTGTDKATADSIDAVSSDVESVRRSRSGANALFIRKNATVTRTSTGRHRARIRLSCSTTALEGCKGRLTLLAKARIGGSRVEALLAGARYNVRTGTARRVTVRLPNAAAELASNRRLKVKAQAVGRNAAGAQTTKTVKVTLRFPKP